jgi:hypothetical protein
MKQLPTRKIKFDVYFSATANSDPKFIKTIDIEVFRDLGEDFLTQKSAARIERVRAKALKDSKK